MKLGQKAMEALKSEVTGFLNEGDELVVAGSIALMGTALIVQKEKEFLKQFFSEGFLWDAERGHLFYSAYETEALTDVLRDACWEEISETWISRIKETPVWKELKGMGAKALYPLNSGGILAGIWKMAEVSDVGLHVDLRKIPVRQETIEICERFDLNPYKLFSGGSLLIGTGKGEAMVRFFQEKGIPSAIVGSVDKGNDRLLYSKGITRYLERPSQDELTRFSWGEKWKSSGRQPGRKEETKEC